MDRRGFLKLLGIGAGVAVVAPTLLITPEDEEWEETRRYWQGWSGPIAPGVTTQAQIDRAVAAYVKDLRLMIEGEALRARNGVVFAKEPLIHARWGLPRCHSP